MALVELKELFTPHLWQLCPLLGIEPSYHSKMVRDCAAVCDTLTLQDLQDLTGLDWPYFDFHDGMGNLYLRITADGPKRPGDEGFYGKDECKADIKEQYRLRAEAEQRQNEALAAALAQQEAEQTGESNANP